MNITCVLYYYICMHITNISQNVVFNYTGKDHCRDSDSSFGLHSPDNLVPGAGQEALQVIP